MIHTRVPAVRNIRGRSTFLRLAGDVRSKPASNTFHQQAPRLSDTGSRVTMVAKVLNFVVQVESGLFRERVVSRVFHLRRLRTEGTDILLAGRRRAGPFTVGPTRSLGNTDGEIIRITSVMDLIAEKSSSLRLHTVLNIAQRRAFSLRLDARHPANTVASALLLLALAIFIGRTLSQTLLAEQFRLSLVSWTRRRRGIPRVLVYASVIVHLRFRLITLLIGVVVLVVLVVPIIVIVVVVVVSRLLYESRFRYEEKHIHKQKMEQNEAAGSHFIRRLSDTARFPDKTTHTRFDADRTTRFIR